MTYTAVSKFPEITFVILIHPTATCFLHSISFFLLDVHSRYKCLILLVRSCTVLLVDN